MGTLIVIGGTGELGHQTVLAATYAADGGSPGWPGGVLATYCNSAPPPGAPGVSWARLDCSDHKAVREFLVGHPGPIGAIAYCAVPKGANANAKPSDTLRTGIVDDVLNCAEAAAMLGARFVAVSTDLVFDGKRTSQQGADGADGGGGRYAVDSAVSPINAYGRCKAEMEKRLLGLSGSHIVIARTSLILSIGGITTTTTTTTTPASSSKPASTTGGSDDGSVAPPVCGKGAKFVLDCIQGKHGEIDLFTDEIRNISFADDLGQAMVELAKPDCPLAGVVHMASDESTNRWEFAQLLARHLRLEHLLGKFARAGLSAESGMVRPLNCALQPSPLKTKIRGVSERLAHN